jgi:FMN phosphatase YigB (HAD superfamily)
VEPAQALFLDDKDKNVTGAEKAGMHAMIFDGEMSVLEKKLTELGVKLDS